jgi:N-acetylglucosaminyldiphosphoundecaprenol N-acetyl-beta-D-mannosaminyltransferase
LNKMENIVSFLGIKVDLEDKFSLTEKVIRASVNDGISLIPHHNLHSLYLFHKYEKFREFYKLADITHIDGMPLILLAKLSGKKARSVNRITYLDWVDILFNRLNDEKKKVFYLGSKPGVAAKAADILRDKYPDITFKVANGYFDTDGDDNREIIQKLNNFNPDILMVGMGMPRQEYWVMDNIEKLKCRVILTSGAFFDYIAGEIKTPPRVMGRIGLEWLYRLVTEPRRLWRRYFLEPAELTYLLIKKKLS